MPLGPGKYGARAEALLRELDGRARAVIVITIGMTPADGAFDVASIDARAVADLPRTLRRVADDIERTLRTSSN